MRIELNKGFQHGKYSFAELATESSSCPSWVWSFHGVAATRVHAALARL